MRHWTLILGLLLLMGCPPAGVVDDDASGDDDDAATDDDDSGEAADLDHDGDGFPESLDCDDSSPYVHPDAVELCGNGVDEDCSGELDDGQEDWDGDGAISDECDGGTDCDDGSVLFGPDVPEIPYDGHDQDCSGGDLVDVDGDGDAAEVAGGGDCDDDDPQIWSGAPEVCDSSIDHDCDGDHGFYDDDCCTLSCSCPGGVPAHGLSCGQGSLTMYPDYAPNMWMEGATYIYGNGVSYSCDFEGNSFGQVTEFDCVTQYGGWQTCDIDC